MEKLKIMNIENVAIPEELKKKFPEEINILKAIQEGIKEKNLEKIKEGYIELFKPEYMLFTDIGFVSTLCDRAWWFLTDGLNDKEIKELQDEIE